MIIINSTQHTTHTAFGMKNEAEEEDETRREKSKDFCKFVLEKEY